MYLCRIKWVLPGIFLLLSCDLLKAGTVFVHLPSSPHCRTCSLKLYAESDLPQEFHLPLFLTSIPLPPPRSPPLSLYLHWSDNSPGQPDFYFCIFPRNYLLYYFCYPLFSAALGQVTPISAYVLSLQITAQTILMPRSHLSGSCN